MPSNFLMDIIADLFCDEGILQGICSSVIFVLCGFDEAQLNRTMLETITHHTPAGASTNTILHYGQEVNTGRFQHYDHGKAENLDIYGQENPPKYHIDALTVPVAAFWSLNDWLADEAV
jgi:lysosomal acid lipase/cholesteryl ester hydrolase